MVNLKLFDTSKLVDKMFGPQKPSSLIKNLGFLFFALLGLLAVICIVLLLRLLMNKFAM
jgi:hypothetical protein